MALAALAEIAAASIRGGIDALLTTARKAGSAATLAQLCRR